MTYFVYILYSEKLKRFYTGTTDDVRERLVEHNTGKYQGGFSTKGIPWVLFLEIQCETSQQAYRLETFIKKMKSSKFIKRLKDEAHLSPNLLQKFR